MSIKVLLVPQRMEGSTLPLEHVLEIKNRLNGDAVTANAIQAPISQASAIKTAVRDAYDLCILASVGSSANERFGGFYLNYADPKGFLLARYVGSSYFMRTGNDAILREVDWDNLHRAVKERVVPLHICLGYTTNAADSHRLHHQKVSVACAIIRGIRTFLRTREAGELRGKLSVEEQLSLFEG